MSDKSQPLRTPRLPSAPSARSILQRPFVRYLTVGVLNTCVGLGTIYFSLYALKLSDPQANVLGYCVGVLCSFVLNKLWTFSARGAAGGQFARFVLVTAIAYLVNLGTVMGLIDLGGVNHYLAQALGVLPYTLLGYFGSRYFAFRDNAVRA